MDKIHRDLEPYHSEGAYLSDGGKVCDHIRQIYEALIPKELRHALGEYYTPDWLAEFTLEKTLELCGERDIRNLSIIDPTCGSGTFLIQSIAKKKRGGCGLEQILSTVAGIDINPLAVLTAKTNYLIMLSDMLDSGKKISVPVYCADILSVFSSSVNSVRDNICPKRQGVLNTDTPVKAILANISADGYFVRRLAGADIIAGNPPWVNWEYLPEKYREQTQSLWTEYGLFSAKGRERSFSKEDISVLITCTVIDKLLKDGGVIGLVARQGLFKASRNGAGFRHFRIAGGQPFRILRVDDLSALTIFGSAVNKTVVFFAQKGMETIYPVSYYLWHRHGVPVRITPWTYPRLDDVLEKTEITELCAFPSVKKDATSPWITSDKNSLNVLGNVLGTNNYRARTGVFTGGANAVYLLNIVSSDNKLISVTNITDKAKRKVAPYAAEIEKEYVFPLLKGGNVSTWNTCYDTYILCPHTAETRMFPVHHEKLRSAAPETMEYLEHFRHELDERKGFASWEKKIQRQEFHALLRVGYYTFSRYKVVWKYIADDFICAVIGSANDPYLGKKLILPNEKLMYISTDDQDEAYYLCGLLSSSPVSQCVKSYMNPTSISAHVLDKLKIPTFDPADSRHNEISMLCREGHTCGGKDIAEFIRRIDIIVRDIFDL